MVWSEKTEVIKGNIGESIVISELEKHGYSVYRAITEGPHTFDFLAIKSKKTILIAEVKTKARLNKYYATGFDVKSLNEYNYIYNTYGIDIIVFFVDEHPNEQRIYCQKLSELMKEKLIDNYTWPNYDIAKGIVFFNIKDMKEVRKLNPYEIDQLKFYSTRTYNYK